MKTNTKVILLTALIAGVVTQPVAAVNWKQVGYITAGIVAISSLGYCVYTTLTVRRSLTKLSYLMITANINLSKNTLIWESDGLAILQEVEHAIKIAEESYYLPDLLSYKHHTTELKGLESIPTAKNLRDLAKGTPCEEIIAAVYKKYNL